MKNCTKCKYAAWKHTNAGKLHPSGDGYCTYPYEVPILPASMYWAFWIGSDFPAPMGGHINRKEELKEDCTYFVLDE